MTYYRLPLTAGRSRFLTPAMMEQNLRDHIAEIDRSDPDGRNPAAQFSRRCAVDKLACVTGRRQERK